MQPGMYQIGFSTVLPAELPSSLYFKFYDRYDPKAKVRYYLKATLNTVDPKDKMKNKQVISIRERPVAFQANAMGSSSNEITTWCCMKQGESKMETIFNKNVFAPNEIAEGQIKVDNSKC